MWKVLKDGKLIKEFETMAGAWRFVLDSQSQSVGWATKYGGWKILEVKESEAS